MVTQQQLRSATNRTIQVQQAAQQRQQTIQRQIAQAEYDKQVAIQKQAQATYEAQRGEAEEVLAKVRAVQKGKPFPFGTENKYSTEFKNRVYDIVSGKATIGQYYPSLDKGEVAGLESYNKQVMQREFNKYDAVDRGQSITIQSKTKEGIIKDTQKITPNYVIDPKTGKEERTGYIKETFIATPQKVIEELRASGETPNINEYGQVSGIRSKSFGNVYTIPAYNKKVEEYNSAKVQDPNIDSRTGKEYGTVTPTPKTGEIFKRYIETEGKVKGTIGYVADWVKGKFDVLEQKNIKASGSATFTTEQQDIIFGGGLRVAPYFIPVAGEVLLISGGIESLGTKSGIKRIQETSKSLQEDKGYNPFLASAVAYGQPVFDIYAGSKVLSLRLFPKEIDYAVKVPSNLKGKTTLITDTSMVVENVPKVKVLKNMETSKVSMVRSGTTTKYQPINPRTITEITSPSDKTFRALEISDQAGNVAGRMVKGGNGRGLFKQNLYRADYTVNPKTKKVTYNIFKNDKFIETRVEDVPKSRYGFTEPYLTNRIKTVNTKLSPIDKGIKIKKKVKTFGEVLEDAVPKPRVKRRTSNIAKSYEQEFLPLTDAKEIVSGEFKTIQKSRQVTELQPARENINIYKKIFTTEPVTNVKGVFNVKKLTGKFAKSSPPDIEIINLKKASPEVQVVGSSESLTPRFTDTAKTEVSGYGEFSIKKKPIIDYSGFLRNKKGSLQVQTLAPQEELMFSPNVVVPKSQSVEYASKFDIFVPQTLKRSSDSMNINVGAVGLTNIQMFKTKLKKDTESELKLNQKQELNQIQDMSQVQKLELTQKSNLRQAQVSQLKQEQKLEQRQEQVSQQKQEMRLNQRQVQRKPERTTPKIKIPELKLSFANKLLKKVKEKPEEFEALVTKFGKDVSLGKRRTQMEAENLLKVSLKTTLRAGGSVSKGGIKLAAKELKSFGGGEFAISKVSPTKIIQRREARLGRRSETSEIQYFKKKGKRGGSLFA